MKDEIARLKRIVADQVLEIDALKLIAKGKFDSPLSAPGYPPHHRCPGIERSSCVRNRWYVQDREKVKDTPVDPDADLRAMLRKYSAAHPCHGFRRAHAYLVHDEGMEINLKKVQRLWREEGLTRQTPRKEVRRGKTTTPVVKANEPNHVWSIDFQYDVTRDGRAVKIVSMIDEFTRESLIDMIERSIYADALAKALSAVFAARGVPGVLRMDNGPEFISKRLARLCGKRIGMAFIPPGTPWNNGYVESFNNHRTRECLRRHDFAHLIEARHTITEFHRDYNHHHRHSSLGYLTPTKSRGTMENNPHTPTTHGPKNGNPSPQPNGLNP